jgi:hypothetical protein
MAKHTVTFFVVRSMGERTCYSSPNFANLMRYPFINEEDYNSGLGLLIAASVCFFVGTG